jgi:hypothetical protein
MRFLRERKRIRRKKLFQKTHRPIEIYQSIFDNPSSMTLLTQQCQAFWRVYGGQRDVAKSFWISSVDTAQCYLEYFAQQCALYHCGEDYLGAEYWVQSRNGKSTDSNESDGLAFHFDKDEIAFSSSGVWRHPSISTVTYLEPGQQTSDETMRTPAQWGAPIIIFETKSIELPPLLKPIPPSGLTPSHAWISFPRPGVHLRFDGNLLHGVASELNSLLYSGEGKYQRLSLAVNLWVKGKPPPMGLNRIDPNLLCDSPPVTLRSFPRCFTRHRLQRMKLRRVVIQQREKTSPEGEEAGEEYLVRDLGGLSPDSVSREGVYRLKEHLEGDTGVIPLACLQREAQQIAVDARYRSRSNGIRIRYISTSN